MFTIVHWEMLNILVALRCWHNLVHDRVVLVWCDNLAVVNALIYKKIKDSTLLLIARNIWAVCAVYNITLNFEHIYGKDNVLADTLSRWPTMANSNNVYVKELLQANWDTVSYYMLYLDNEI